MILLALVALFISAPVKKAIAKGVDERFNFMSSFFKDKTGLSITYESLSPSVLSSFYIRNINVYDDDKNLVLKISKTKVNYNILSLIRNDMQKGISSIVVDGIDLDVDILVNILTKIKMDDSVVLDLREIKKHIPANIRLKNINLEYSDQNMTVVLGVKNISLRNPYEKNTMEFLASANFNGAFKTVSQKVSAKMEVSGTVTEHFNDSQLNLKLRDITNGDLKISKLNLHASYSNNIIEAHTIQAVNPISLGCTFNTTSQDFNVQLITEKLRPVSVISANSRQTLIKKIKDLSFDTDTIVKCNFKDRTLNFVSDTKAFIPDAIFPGGAELSLSLFGDEKKAELTDFSINGTRCSADAKLSFIYETKQLSGLVEIPQLILDNGKVITTELYFDPLEKGFMAFSPQFFAGDRALTALQLTVLPQKDSYDFNFEVYDYSHFDEAEPGVLSLDGSFLNQSKYFQTNITLNSIYLDSIAGFAAQFMEETMSQTVNNMLPTLSPFLLSGDAYASTDLNTFSYNVPYVILANTHKDNQALMLAVNGTDRSIQLDQLSLILGKYSLEASAMLEQAPESSDVFFTADINADSIPYHFTGSYMSGICTLTDDYGTDVQVYLDKTKQISGHADFRNFPIKAFDKSVVLTMSSMFNYNNEDGPSVQLTNFELEEAGGSISVNPKIVLSGNVTRYGAAFDSIAYTDLYSVLQGSANLLLNVNEGIFDSIGLMLNLNNSLTEESIIIDGSVSNPDHLAITKDNLVRNIYMNLQMQVKNFSLNRFAAQKNDNNLLSGMLFASGTVEHPYISLNIDSVGLLLAADMLRGRGNVIIEDRDLSITDLDIDYTGIKISNIQAKASVSDMWLEATGELNMNMMNKNIYAPLKLSIGNSVIPEGSIFPDYFTATLSVDDFSGSMLKKKFPASVSVLYENKNYNIFSSDNIGLRGSLSDDGILDLEFDNKKFFNAKIAGLIQPNNINLNLYDFMINLPEAFKYLNVDDLMLMEGGIFTGDFILTGSFDDPDINGTAVISSPSAKLPLLSKQRVFTQEINILVENNEIIIPETVFNVKNNQRFVTQMNVFLNKWSLDHVEGAFKTYKTDQLHVGFKTSELSVEGNIATDLSMFLENNVLELSGWVSGENVDAVLRLFSLSNLASSASTDVENPLQIIADIDVMLGTHVAVELSPVIRCVFVPNTKITVNINQPSGIYMIDGDLRLKSGDLSYLNRSFYIKSGAIKFNKNDISNPIITLNAETREKDENAQTVKIILSVEEQYLKSLQPKFASEPPKSENEIKALLGQIVIADSDSAADILFAASDYALQSTLMRQAENKLRDLLNFDIFSVRTNILQNTYNLSVSKNLSSENLSIGNFLDNTTVYIGKYLGSFLYVDAMLHVTFADNIKGFSDTGKLMFQPEIGMELESPFANVRVNMAPDINALLKNQFVPSTSVTLSWKFTY